MTTNEQVRAAALKPCPFCGQEPEQNAFGYYHLGSEVREIRCVNADCRVKPLITRDQAEESEFSLLEEWNTRADPALDPATVEACAKVADSFVLDHIWNDYDRHRSETAEAIADAIRALASGETK